MSIDYEAQLKLQAYLDGELSPAEAREMGNRLAQDSEAGALLEELRNTRQAMVSNELEVALPESREFFWSKVQREIERAERVAAAEPAAPSWGVLLRRFLAPATAVAVVGIAMIIAFQPNGVVPAETALADPGAFTYHDDSAGTTLVWLSYPAEDEEVPGDEMGSVE